MAENKKMINVTTNGFEVFGIIDDQHMITHSISEEHLAEAIERVELAPPFGFYTIDLGRVVGTSDLVKTTPEDDIRMECRPGRDLPSRMVYGRDPEPTSLVTVGICTDDDGLETMFTAFYGELSPKELSDPRLSDAERPEAEAFWSTHALVAK